MFLMVAMNRALIRKRLVPKLYKSGVRYQIEQQESFVDALTCYKARVGDCAHLAAWRCAELQELGEPAGIRLKWTHPRFHVQVRRANGAVEDPSRILGMGR